MWFGFRPTPPLRAAGLFTFTGGATMKKGLILPLPSIVVGTSEEEREKPVNEDQSSLCVFGERESSPPHFAHIRTGHFVSFSSIYGLGTERSVEKRGAFYEGGRVPLFLLLLHSLFLLHPFHFLPPPLFFPGRGHRISIKCKTGFITTRRGERRRSRGGGGEKKDVHFFTHVAVREKMFVSC